MNRLNKLDTDVELEILPGQQNTSVSPSSTSAVYGGSYESYGNVKEYYCGKRDFNFNRIYLLKYVNMYYEFSSIWLNFLD